MCFNRSTLPAALLLIFASLVTVFAGCSSKSGEEEGVVARVGSFEISDRHFQNEMVRFWYRTGQAVNLNYETRQAVVDSRINRYAIVEYARDNGWHQDAEGIHQQDMITRRVNMEEYQRLFIYPEVQIDQHTLRELFYRVNTTLRASHLVAQTRAEADSLIQLLNDGATFEELAKDIFRDPSLRDSGGDLGFFTVDDMDIAFENAAYQLMEGQVSKPIRTSTGFSVIKVTEIIETPVITETEFANKIHELQPIARDQQKELATRRHLTETVESFNISADLAKELWEAVKNQYAVPVAFDPEATQLSVDLPRELRNQTIVDTPDFTFTVNDFLTEAHYTSNEQRQRARNHHDFKDQLGAMAYRTKAQQQVRSHPDYNDHFVTRSIEETFYSYLIQRFDRHLDTLVEIDRDEIVREYHQNREYYQDPLKLNLAEIIISSEERAEEAWEKLEEGADFYEILHQYTIDPDARHTNGELGFIPIDRFGVMSPNLGRIMPGETAGPFQIASNRFIIFKCLDRIEARPLSLDEAESLVKEHLHYVKKEEYRDEKVRQSREKHNAVVYTDRLNSLPIEL